MKNDKAPARELTRAERTAIRRLVRRCANYDAEYGCLPLDSSCYMLGKWWTGGYCRYFQEAVLPLDPAWKAALITGGTRPWPRTGGKRTARQPVQKEPTASSSGNICEKNGAHLLTIRPRKAHIYQGFFGPDSGRVIYFYARLVLVPILSTFTHRPAAPVYTVSA